MQTGEIFLIDNRLSLRGEQLLPCCGGEITGFERVICFDDVEVLTDVKGLKQPEWLFDGRRSAVFMKTSRITFERRSVKVGHAPYKISRLEILRPDLPIRTCRFKSLSWGDAALDSQASIRQYFKRMRYKEKMLNTPMIYLGGYNDQEIPQRSVLLRARNGNSFAEAELLAEANVLQARIKKDADVPYSGIGIYREGIRNGIPSYYMWGYYDLANCLNKYEEAGFDISRI